MDIPQNLSDPPNENMPYIFSGSYEEPDNIERLALPVGKAANGPSAGRSEAAERFGVTSS